MTQIYPVKSPRKLIEVALPLDAINEAAAREKSIRHGHPSTLHLWWARRPLAAARAVLFAQLVNDPGTNIGRGFKYGIEKKKAAIERKRLFKILEDLVQWENTTNETVVEKARAEIVRSWQDVCELNKDHPRARELFNPKKLPAFHDPFSGGGAIPLEAQRLSLEAYASDLNPIAVLITKAMIEIPPKFRRRPPINPVSANKVGGATGSWNSAGGLAQDVHYYGSWIREEAERRIGYLYPAVNITAEMVRERVELKPLLNQSLTVIAWLWARTVKSPNPAFSNVQVPLASTFTLSSKLGKEAFVQPIVEGDNYRFAVRIGKSTTEAERGTSAGKRKGFRCLLSGAPIDYDYIRREARAGRMKERLLAVVAEGPQGRTFIGPTDEIESVAKQAMPTWKPSGEIPQKHRNFQPPVYGMYTFGDLFTSRQLVALNTFSELVGEAQERIRSDAVRAGMSAETVGLHGGGTGAHAYAEAVSVYLAFLVSQLANHCCSICGWNHPNTQMRSVFSRQAIPMTWDYAEVNVFSTSSGSYSNLLERQVKGMAALAPSVCKGWAFQADAQTQTQSIDKCVSTDPPYYDNIAYADLSDFFYSWIRKMLRGSFPDLLATISVPKTDELVVAPHRHAGKEQAEEFFLSGMTKAMAAIAQQAHPAFPITIYYAFKQSETESESGTSSSGWEAFLDAIMQAGFSVTGTWPMRTEKQGRSIQIGMNALASSIILVCRKRPNDAPSISRREFLRELNATLPLSLEEMIKGGSDERSPVAPVDLSQAMIGPGMAVFSKYAAVLEADGTPMTIKTALQLINRFFAAEDFDSDTQFCLQWFQQHRWNSEAFGEADVLARAKGTSVDGVKRGGVITSAAGKVRLLKWSEYPTDWNSQTDFRLPVWEALHHLIRAHRMGGDSAAGQVFAGVRGKSESARQLAYRLYTLCERSGWAEDARAYNEIITSWPAIESAAGEAAEDRDLFGETV